MFYLQVKGTSSQSDIPHQINLLTHSQTQVSLIYIQQATESPQGRAVWSLSDQFYACQTSPHKRLEQFR